MAITIPKDVNISDYYFSILFISEDQPPTTSSVSLNLAGIGTNVILSVGEKEKPNAILQEFSTPLFTEKGPVPFTIRIDNKGDHFIKPQGNIIIKNMFGQSVGKLDLLPFNILSGSIRSITNPGSIWKESFLLGYYTSTLNVSLSDEGPVFTKTIHFFALPVGTLIIIIIIAILGTIIRNRIKRYMQ